MITVLVVEPWSDWKVELGKRLEQKGIEETLVETKTDAEKSIQRRTFDAYIINSHLPKTEHSPHLPENGLELVRLIGRQRGNNKIHYLSYDENARTAARQEGITHLYDKNKGYFILDEVVENILTPTNNGR